MVFHAESQSWLGSGQTGDRNHIAGKRFFYCLESGTGVGPDLGNFFLPAIAGQNIADFQTAGGDLQVGQTDILVIPGDFEHFRAEFP